MVTQGREGEQGSWCVKCGVKVLDVEKRICDLCKHFVRPRSPISSVLPVPPYCMKLKMHVISGMHVTYHTSEGTCFETDRVLKLKYGDGQPCNHPGCMAHISHPCEGCGRRGAIGEVYEVVEEFPF